MSTEEIGSDEWYETASRWAKAKLDPERGEITTRSLTEWDANPRWEASVWLTPDVWGLGFEVTRDMSIGTTYANGVAVPIWQGRRSLNVTLLWWSFSLSREKEWLRDPQDVAGPSQCCPKAYWCPTVKEVECPDHSGFSICCSGPDLHRQLS